MFYVKLSRRIPSYRQTGCNQHGTSYVGIRSKYIRVAKLSCNIGDIDGTRKLIALGHTLDAPVRYDFDEDRAYIEVVSNESLGGCI